MNERNKKNEQPERIVGAVAMAVTLQRVGVPCLLRKWEGHDAVVVPFADGWAQWLRDFGSGDWEYQMDDAQGEEQFGGSGDVEGDDMVGSVRAYVVEHGLADAAGAERWAADRTAALAVRATPPTVTVTLTAAQLRLLRDLVHWAATDIREGPEETFWNYIVPEGEDEWDEAVETMQEINAVFNPESGA